MSKPFSDSALNTYSDVEWKFTKISVLFFWLVGVRSANINTEQLPYPGGIFSFFNGSFLASPHTSLIFLIGACILAVFYMAEKWMTATTFLMFLLSLVLFSLEESSGILNRRGLFTAIFLAQCIAYFRNTSQLKEERIQFPVQIIAAGYVLAGISKVRESGLLWFTRAPMVSIQIIKGYSYAYFNTGDIRQFNKGMKHANFILQHAFLAKALLGTSLILELFAWVGVRNKQTTFIFGLMLAAMHLGIWYFMNILIAAVVYPMLIFMVNPLYLLYLLFRKLWPEKMPKAEITPA